MLINNQNIYHSLMCRELGGSFSSEKVKNRLLMTNIQGGNCAKRIFNGHGQAIGSFDVKGYFALTNSGWGEIKLWNLETGNCQWTKSQGIIGFARILGEYVLDVGIPFNQGACKIKILDLKTGKEMAYIEEMAICQSTICIVGQRIFAALNNGTIGEWTIQGERKGTISCPVPFGFHEFTKSENFLVNVNKKQFFVYNLQKESSFGSVRTIPGSPDMVIETSCLVEDRLICGYRDQEDDKSYVCCCVIDLATNEIISRYRIRIYIDLKDFEHQGLLVTSQILSHKEFIYLGLWSGELFVIDMAKNTHIKLDDAPLDCRVSDLAVEGQTLIGGFRENRRWQFLNKVKFWNIHSLEPIGERQLPFASHNMHFDSGKLRVIAEKSLVQWDYFVSEKGENLVDGSPAEIQHGGRAV